MQPNPSQTTEQYTEEEMRQAIAAESKIELSQLNRDYLVGHHQTETIRFGDLPLYEQESLRKALEAQARGEVVKYEL
ncbi:MAG: hypothetical protein ACRDEA_21590 [Microcystaceae cyanobacterium]